MLQDYLSDQTQVIFLDVRLQNQNKVPFWVLLSWETKIQISFKQTAFHAKVFHLSHIFENSTFVFGNIFPCFVDFYEPNLLHTGIPFRIFFMQRAYFNQNFTSSNPQNKKPVNKNLISTYLPLNLQALRLWVVPAWINLINQ